MGNMKLSANLRILARELTPPILWSSLKRVTKRPPPGVSLPDSPAIMDETIDYYAYASAYALHHLQARKPLKNMTLLSATARIFHLADYLALFDRAIHSTMVQTSCPAINDCQLDVRVACFSISRCH
jgi:hypothetical protein